jgi:DNA polymerase-4
MPLSGHILHADLDAFYASVEQRDDPRLRGRPVIVGGGVVLAASYEAKAMGVTSATSVALARRLCPGAIVVPPRFAAYTEASRAVFEVFNDTTPLVEGVSIDEAFLDVGGLRALSGSPTQIGARLRREVRERVGLGITVGIARTKFLAKVASAQAKPDGLLCVPVDGELDFLHPLPVRALWGVGASTSGKLAERGLFTVGDVAALAESTLVTMLGPGVGRQLHALARNRDPRPVDVGRRRRSIGAQRALGRRRTDLPDIEASLSALVDRVCGRLRAANRRCHTVMLRLRFEDFSRVTRSRTLPARTDSTAILLGAAKALLGEAAPLIYAGGLTLIGVALANLEDGQGDQLELPLGVFPGAAVDAAVDASALGSARLR